MFIVASIYVEVTRILMFSEWVNRRKKKQKIELVSIKWVIAKITLKLVTLAKPLFKLKLELLNVLIKMFGT